MPVAPRPALEALEVGGESLREAVVKGDVARESRAGQFALDEVVAEDAALGQLALHRGHEGAHVVDALAAKGAMAGDVLIEFGDGDGVAVHAAAPGKEVDEAVFDRRSGQFHVRLHDGIAAPRAVFHARAVERVQQRSGKGVDRAGEGTGVGVERRHQMEAPGKALAGRAFGGESPVGVALAQQQAVERHQRAALALASHPALVRGVKTALAVQVEVLLPPGALVHGADAGADGGQYLRVVRLRGGGTVAKIAEEEVGGVIGVVEAAKGLKPVAEFEGALRGAEQRRHHDQQPPLLPQRVRAELEQAARADEARGKAADELHGRAPRERHAQHRYQPAARNAGVEGKQRRRQQRLHGDELMAARVGRQARQALARAEAGGQCRAALVLIEPPADRAARALMLFCRRHGLSGHGLFAEAQAAADRLHLFAHGSLRFLVHARIGAVRVGAQFGLGAGEAREALLPVQSVQHALAANEVIQAHGKQGLRLVFLTNHALAALAQLRHALLQARAHAGQLPLHGQLQRALEKGRRVAHAARAFHLHKALGGEPLTGALQYGAGAVAKALRQSAAQGGGHSPEFGHGQRLHLVEGAQGHEHPLAAEGGVAQRDDLAHEHKHARFAANGAQAHAAVQTRLRGAGFHDACVLMQAFQRGGGAGTRAQKRAGFARKLLDARRQRFGTGEAGAAIHAQLHRQRAHVPRERLFVPLRRAGDALCAPRADAAQKPCLAVHMLVFLLKYHR